MFGIIGLLIIGAAAGFIATRLMGMETGLLPTIAIGVIGALIGGLLLRALLSVLGIFSGFLGAILGALVLLWAYKTFAERR